MASSELDQYLLALGATVSRRLQARGIAQADAEDAVGATFVKILTLLPELTPANLDAWFYRVALNQYIDTVRKHRREWLTDTLPEAPRETPASFATLIAPLAAADQELLALKYYYGFGYADIATLLALSPAVVKTRLARARKRLKQLMEEED